VKILLAADGSEYSKGAAEFLTSLDLSSDDEIIIFHAICWIPCIYGRESYYDTLKAMKKEIVPRILDSALQVLNPVKAGISTLILDGSPDDCIMNASVDSDIDLIVVGARGTKGTDSPFIGSVAKAVVIESSKPVLVVKLPVCGKSEKIKILFATDGSKYSAATARLLSEIPFPDRSEITVLNVMPWGFPDTSEPFVPGANGNFSEIMEESRATGLTESKKIIDESRENLGKKFTNICVLTRIGETSTEIIKASEKLETNLIAVGCRGLRGIKGMMGSVTRKVLTDSRCSILIGKAC
jgi:nucleotide-binding universal stress UspA family protein